jgi:Putative Ig domain/NHL repeat
MEFFAKRWRKMVRSVLFQRRHRRALSSRTRPAARLFLEEMEPRLTPSGNINTIAGTGSSGYSGDGGPATSAKLYNPYGTAVDSSGNVYIADTQNDRIREVAASTGIITTVAGNGTVGYSGDNGPATSAAIDYPFAVAVDSSGNIYIADSFNNRIREVVKATGNITTIAGNGTAGFTGDGGAATSAEINMPEGVAVDSSGNVFFSDEGNQRIREIVKATGTITTVAGNGTWGYNGDGELATSAELFYPKNVAVDPSGNIYIADWYNNRIREVVKSTGDIATVAGTGTGSYNGDGIAATSAMVNHPNGVAVDSSGNIYIGDTYNSRIREVNKATGIITTIAGNGTAGYSGDGGPPTSAKLYDPYGVALDSSNNIYIADSFNYRIREVLSYAPPTLGSLSSTAWTVNQTSYIGVVAVSNGTAPYSNLTATGLPAGLTASLSGSTITLSGTPTAAGTFNNVNISVKDSVGTTASHTYTITINATPTLGSLSPTQGYVSAWGYPGAIPISGGTGPFLVTGQANLPPGLTATTTGTNITFTGIPTTAGTFNNVSLTVRDMAGATVSGVYTITIVVAPAGSIITFAGNGTAGYSGDGGIPIAAALNFPHGVAADSSGNIYIADAYNNRIREVVKATGNIITVAGTGAWGYSGDGGAATSAMLNGPTGVTVDSSGNIYIADAYNNRVREVVKATGNIITIAGNGTLGFWGDGGAATSAELYFPYAVAVDSSGNVFIADSSNDRIREVVKSTGTITTFAGTGTTGYSGDGGPATSAKLSQAYGVAVDSSGNVYIADAGNNRIREVAASTGVITTFAGNGTSGFSGDGGAATSAALFSPQGVYVDAAGNVYISDTANYRIREVSHATGVITTIAGNGTSGGGGDAGPPTSASLNGALSMAVDPAGNVFIADPYNNRVREIPNASPSLSNLSSTAWTVNQAGFSGSIAVSGGTAPYSNLTVTGLPAGLTASLSGSTITISGTPTATGTFSSVNVSIHDANNNTASGTYTITINAAPTLGTLSQTQWTLNRAFNGTIGITGGTGAYGSLTYSGLPTGLSASLSGSTIIVSGTPTATGTYSSVTVSIRDASGTTASHTYSMTINAAPALGTLSQTQWTVNRTGYYATTVVTGGTAPLSLQSWSGLPPGLSVYVNGTTIVVTGTPTSTGTYTVNLTVADTTGAAASGTYTIIINAVPTLGSLTPSQWTVNQAGYTGAVPIGGGTGPFTVSGANLPAGLTPALSGSTVTFTGTPTTAGTYSSVQLTVQDTTGASYTGTYSITINPLPTLGTLSSTQWTVNQAGYSGTIGITGGTPAIGNLTVTGLPAGLSASLSSSTITISGMPTATGSFTSVNVSVKDASGYNVSHTFTITINAAPTLGTLSQAQWTVNRPGYSGAIVVTGGTGAYSNLTYSGLPAGLSASLNGSTITVSGTPTATGTSNATITVKDATGATASRIYSMTINVAPTLNVLSIPAWTVNQYYSGMVGISGGTSPFSILTVSGLPSGLSAWVSGASVMITGTPSTTGTYSNINVNVKDVAGAATSRTYSMTINPAPSLGGITRSTWTVTRPGFPGTIAVSGGTGTLTLAGQANLPPGLTASLSGTTISITGTPTTTGVYSSVSFAVRDSAGAVSTQTYTIIVNTLPTLSTMSTAWTVNSPGLYFVDTIMGGSTSFTNLNVTGLPAGVFAYIAGNLIGFGGTPTAVGTFNNINISVQDATGAVATGTASITINPAPTLGALSNSAWTVGRAGFSGTIGVTGGTQWFSNLTVTGLPAGLTATQTDATTITISGTPTVAGSFNNINVSITDAAHATATGTFSMTINAVPTLGSLSSTAWTVNQAGFSSSLAIVGGTSTFGNLTVSGLPAGLSAALSGSTVTISGTPTATGSFNNVSVSVTDASGAVASGTFAITVDAAPTLGSLTSGQWTVGQGGYSDTIAVNNGTGPFVVSAQANLPPGLTAIVTGANVTFTGTPTTVGTFNNVQLTVQDAAGATASGTFSITINPAPTLGSLSQTQWTINQPGYSGAIGITGGTGTSSNLAATGLPSGLSAILSGNTITLSGTPTATGSFNNVSVSVTDASGAVASGTFAITINVAPTLGSLTPGQWTVGQGGYSDTIAVNNGTGPFVVSAQANLPSGLTAIVTGTNVTFTGTPTTVGSFNNLQLTVQDAAGATASGTFSITVNPAPTLGSLSQTQWTVNQSGYSGTIGITGGTGTFSSLTATGLPSGLSAILSGNTITLSGTPTATGSFNNVSVSVTDASGAVASGTFAITINVAPTLGSLTPGQWTVGQGGYSDTIAVNNGTGPFVVSAQANLPSGLTAIVTGTNVTFTGTPTTVGPFNNVQLTVQDAAGATASDTFSITINPAPTLGSLSQTQWTVNQLGYSGTIGITGGTGAYSNLTATGLPSGLSATLSGNTISLSGTPAASGTFNNIDVSVMDAAGATVSSTFSITVNAAPALGSLTTSQWTLGQSGYTGAIPLSGGTGALVVSAQANLPPGLTAIVTGTNVTFSGTPTSVGTFNNVQLTVQDATGASSTGTFSITINAAPTLGSLSVTQWTVNQAGYSGIIAVTGGTTAFSNLVATGLPPGLSAGLNGTTIILSGTPTTAGAFSAINISVTDAAGATASGTFAITINPTGLISTVGGNGTAGYSGDGGAATSAQLDGPSGVAVDSSGDLFIADTVNNRIREVVQATGNIITVAGAGVAGYSGDGAAATSAQLNAPSAVAVDSSGDLFIADTGNNVIREVIQATGIIITVAGNGTAGDGGAGATAQLNGPHGVAVDSSGNLFIADTGNNVIREVVQATSNIITVAGTGAAGYSGDGGPASSAELNAPFGVAVDANGNIFIADTGNNAVREVVQATGYIITVAGTGSAGYSGDGATATSAQLNGPVSVAVDQSGNLFIADSGNNAVREVVQATGYIVTVAGTGTAGYSGDGGLASNAQLNGPDGVTVDANGDLFIGDTGNNCIRKVR